MQVKPRFGGNQGIHAIGVRAVPVDPGRFSEVWWQQRPPDQAG